MQRTDACRWVGQPACINAEVPQATLKSTVLPPGLPATVHIHMHAQVYDTNTRTYT